MIQDNTAKWRKKKLSNFAPNEALPVGHIYQSLSKNVSVGSLPLTGGAYDRTLYADLWSWANENGLVVSEDEWQASASAAGGSCSKFSDGNGTTTFRVPALTGETLSEISDYIVKSWNEGSRWCHLYKSGWVRQGGRLPEGVNGQRLTIPFIRAFVDDNYTLLKTNHFYYGDAVPAEYVNAINRTPESFDVIVSAVPGGYSWYAEGQSIIPTSEEFPDIFLENTVGMYYIVAYGTVTNIGNVDLKHFINELEQVKVEVGNVSVMQGATATKDGKEGLVPAPAADKQGSFLRGDGTWATPDQGAMTASYTGSTQEVRQAKVQGYIGSYDSNLPSSGSGNVSSTQYVLSTNTGMPSGTYTLKSLLQSLINLSHSHTIAKGTTYSNCNCNCDCDCYIGDGSCIISGKVNLLNSTSPVDISDVKPGDYILGIDGKYHKVLDIKVSTLNKRKAITFEGLLSCVFTDDHAFLLTDNNYGVYDVEGYVNECSRDLIGSNGVRGTYKRTSSLAPIALNDLAKSVQLPLLVTPESKATYSTRLVVLDMPDTTYTYTPIMDDKCEWIWVNNIPVASAYAL